MINFAITGAGYIARIHARAIINSGGRVASVVSRPTENRGLLAAATGATAHDNLADALRAGNIDAVVVCTPNYLHAPETLAALSSGIPVMVEKPMAMNGDEAAQMLDRSAQSGALLMVAHCWRFDEDTLWLKQQTPRLGRIIRTKGYGVHSNWGPSGWFTEKRYAGGGAMADMGIHAIDTARFLLGDPRPVSVYARLSTEYTKYDVDDTGVVLVNWDNGALSYIESGWWQPQMDGPEAATQLYGTQGFGRLFPTRLELPNAAEDRVDVVDPGFEYPREEHCPQTMYDAQIAYFMHCIETNTSPVPGGREGLVNMRVVDAAYESSRTGRLVEVVQ